MKTAYLCQQCAYSSPKWIGKCPQCENWNCFEEQIQEKRLKGSKKQAKPAQPVEITRITNQTQRIKTNISEIDRVLGGGMVRGNMILLSGEPGIGKSTLTLQLSAALAVSGKTILYISGEESIEQISLRARRLDAATEKLKLLNETDFETIIATIDHEKPDFVIIDSIQVIGSENYTGLPGSITQVRGCTEVLMEYAKRNKTSILLIGHVTKEGNLAGPRVLEHLVDTVLFLEGDRYHELRLLRNLKNRFGATTEVGIFEMHEKGLKEVKNPSAAFLNERQADVVGSCIGCTIEGSRPILVEIQALTNLTPFGYPRRTASGFDVNRLQLLIAVLQKHAAINLSNQDVYLNIVGGITIKDPACDLAACCAIVSSYKKQPLSKNIIAIGEIGLTGEIRKGIYFDRREKEAQKHKLSAINIEKNNSLAVALKQI